MAGQQGQKKGGAKKHGRNKRVPDQAMSAYVRGKIDFSTYWKRSHGVKYDLITLNKPK
jgi:hypothetical protein